MEFNIVMTFEDFEIYHKLNNEKIVSKDGFYFEITKKFTVNYCLQILIYNVYY